MSNARYYYAGMLFDGDRGPIDDESAVDYMFKATESDIEDAIECLTENGLINPRP